MISDQDGYLWIRPSTPSGASTAGWVVYDPEGAAAANIEMPADLIVLDVDATHVIGKRVDELGVETVFSYRVGR